MTYGTWMGEMWSHSLKVMAERNSGNRESNRKPIWILQVFSFVMIYSLTL